MKIAIGSDHGGFALKEVVRKHLLEKGYEIEDYGTYNTESCNYPDFGLKVAEAIAAGKHEFGVLVCGTGIGISISANKVPGIRAAHVTDHFSAKYTRLHNNSQIICLGERITGPGVACELVDLFLTTGFEGGRHAERLDLIKKIEEKYSK